MAATTTEQAAARLDLSPRQVRRLIDEGDLTTLRRANAKDRKRTGCAPNAWMIDGDSVLKLKRARKAAGR
jgi:hypothetical protein